MSKEITERMKAELLKDANENFDSLDRRVVEANIERVFANAEQIYGSPAYGWSTNRESVDTHTAILVGIRALKPVDPLVEKLHDLARLYPGHPLSGALVEAADRLESLDSQKPDMKGSGT